jgi:hypothetical protein
MNYDISSCAMTRTEVNRKDITWQAKIRGRLPSRPEAAVG